MTTYILIAPLLAFVSIVLSLFATSFLLVGIGLFFKQDLGPRRFKDGTVVANYELPEWLKPLHNPEDNLTGDKRGWYWNEYMAGRPDWWKMLIWSAMRNPFNHFKRITLGCDVREYTITKLIGDDYVRDKIGFEGFQILLAKSNTGGMTKPALYWVRRWGKSDRAIVFQFGWKLKLSHNGVVEEDEIDYYKGLTFEPNPVKRID